MSTLIINQDELISAQENNSVSLANILLKLKPIFDKNYKKYKYLPIELYNSLAEKGIKFLIDNSKVDRIYDFYDYINTKVGSIIDFQLSIAVNSKPPILYSYIDLQKKDRLFALSKLLNRLHTEWSIDVYIDILNRYPDFEQTLKLMIGETKEIDSKTIQKLSFNTYVEQFIRAYMLKYDIEETFEDEVDEPDLESSDNKKADVDYSEVTDPIRQFLLEIGRYPLLKFKEEQEYFRLLNEGKEEYREKIINSNLRLVVSIAKRYVNRGVLFQDLIQEGCLGLMKAVDYFDYKKGYKFSTYSTWWIRQSITRSIGNDGRTVRLPIHVHEKVLLIRKTQRTFQTSNSREPSYEELSAILDMPVQMIAEYMTAANDPTSLSVLIGDDDTELEAFIPDKKVNVEDEALDSDLQRQVRKLLENSNMDERFKEVIKYRFGFYGRIYTLEEVGQILGVTRERVRQMEAKALLKLRRNRATKDYAVYMDDPERAKEYIDASRKMDNYGNKAAVPGFDEAYSANDRKKSGRKPKETQPNIKTGTLSLMEYLKIPADKQDYLYDCIVELNENTMNLLVRQFGEDFKGLKKNDLTNEERNHLFIDILPILSRIVHDLLSYDRDSMDYINRLKTIGDELNSVSWRVIEDTTSKKRGRRKNTDMEVFTGVKAYDGPKKDIDEVTSFPVIDDSTPLESDTVLASPLNIQSVQDAAPTIKKIAAVPVIEKVPDPEPVAETIDTKVPVLEESKEEEVVNDTSATVASKTTVTDEVKATRKKKGSQSFDLIAYFNNVFTKDELMAAISLLDSQEQQTILCVCGDNLDGTDTTVVDKEERKRFNTNYIPKVKSRLTKLYRDRVGNAIKPRQPRKNAPSNDAIEYMAPQEIVIPKEKRVVDKGENVITTYEEEKAIETQEEVPFDVHETLDIPPTGGEEAKKTTSLAKDKVFKIVPVPDLPFIGTGMTQTTGSFEPKEPVIKEPVITPKCEDKVVPRTKTVIPVVQKEESVTNHDKLPETSSLTEQQTIVKDKSFGKEDLLFIQNIINSEEFQTMIKMSFTIDEVLVALMLHYGFNGKTFGISKIADFLHTSEEVVKEIAKRSIQKYKDLMNKKFDEYEEHLLNKKHD